MASGSRTPAYSINTSAAKGVTRDFGAKIAVIFIVAPVVRKEGKEGKDGKKGRKEWRKEKRKIKGKRGFEANGKSENFRSAELTAL